MTSIWLFYKVNELCVWLSGSASHLSLHHKSVHEYANTFIYINYMYTCAWMFLYNVCVYGIQVFSFLFSVFKILFLILLLGDQVME